MASDSENPVQSGSCEEALNRRGMRQVECAGHIIPRRDGAGWCGRDDRVGIEEGTEKGAHLEHGASPNLDLLRYSVIRTREGAKTLVNAMARNEAQCPAI